MVVGYSFSFLSIWQLQDDIVVVVAAVSVRQIISAVAVVVKVEDRRRIPKTVAGSLASGFVLKGCQLGKLGSERIYRGGEGGKWLKCF